MTFPDTDPTEVSGSDRLHPTGMDDPDLGFRTTPWIPDPTPIRPSGLKDPDPDPRPAPWVGVRGPTTGTRPGSGYL